MPTRTYTTREVCAVAQVTYRRLDYWVRIGLLEPAAGGASGSGSVRRWQPRQVATVAVLGMVAEHRQVGQLLHLREFLEDLPLEAWGRTRVLLDDQGDVWRLDGERGPVVGTYIDLDVVTPVVEWLAIAGGVA